MSTLYNTLSLVGIVGSRCPHSPEATHIFSFLKEVQFSCQESLALGLQSLLLNVCPEGCKKARAAWCQGCLQGQEDLRLCLF